MNSHQAGDGVHGSNEPVSDAADSARPGGSGPLNSRLAGRMKGGKSFGLEGAGALEAAPWAPVLGNKPAKNRVLARDGEGPSACE